MGFNRDPPATRAEESMPRLSFPWEQSSDAMSSVQLSRGLMLRNTILKDELGCNQGDHLRCLYMSAAICSEPLRGTFPRKQPLQIYLDT